MNASRNKEAAGQLLSKLGIAAVGSNWTGCGEVWDAFEKMADEGATVVIKIDGQRKSVEDSGRYTLIVSGGPLNEDFFRTDCSDLDEGLAQAVLHYARHGWKQVP